MRTQKIWRDGQFVDWPDATIHVLSHVVHYGSSIFEGIRCYKTSRGGAVFRLRDHIRRLTDSARIYRIPLAYSVDVLIQGCVDTVAANDLEECYLRPVVMRTGERMGVMPEDRPNTVETFIIAWKWGQYLGDDALARGVDVCVSSWRRAAPDTFPTLAKAGGNYLNGQLSLMEARANGYVEGIMLDSAGFVSEGTGENIFVVRDGIVHTPPMSAGILGGITRDTVMRLLADLGHEVRETLMPREFLYMADEVFFSGTAAEITPVRSIDHIEVGAGKPGPISLAVQDRYLGVARGRYPDPYGWLTPVPEPAVAAR